MISDYFYDPNKKHNEEQRIEFTVARLNDIKDYIRSKLFAHVEDLIAPEGTYIPVSVTSPQNAPETPKMTHKNMCWSVTSNKNFFDPSKDRFYISHNYFERFTTEWTQKTKVKLERIDWCYLIYQVVHERTEDNPGYNVAWSDGTLGIHLDKPAVCI